MSRRRTAAYGPAARSRIGWPGNSALPRSGRSAAGKRSRRLVGRSSRRVPATHRQRAPRRRRLIKKLTDVVAEEAAKHPDKSIEVWATDEHRLGLKPIHRRVWAPIGERPIALGHHRYEWLYVTGFVAPASGETVWYLSNGIDKPFFAKLLAAFARQTGAGRDRIIVLQLDNAGWHGPENLPVPDGIRLVYQPPRSPELQPAERLWPLVDEPLVNKHFATIDDLDAAVAERCCFLLNAQAVIKSHTNFHWWPKTRNPT